MTLQPAALRKSLFVLAVMLMACYASATAFAQDSTSCDPNADPACFCFDSDGFECDPADGGDCMCESWGEDDWNDDDWGDDDWGDDAIAVTPECAPFLECAESCAEDDFGCIDACAGNVSDAQTRDSIEALVACVQSSGCDLADDACLESTCDAQAQGFVLACYGDDFDDWDTDDLPGEYYCFAFDECVFECDEDDFACVESCASQLSGEQRSAFDSAMSCVTDSGCADDDFECLENTCFEAVEEFFESCFGDGWDVDSWDDEDWHDETSNPSNTGGGGTDSGSSNNANGGGSGGGANFFRNGRSPDTGSSGGSTNTTEGGSANTSGCTTVNSHNAPSAPWGALGLLALGMIAVRVRRRG